MKIRISLHNSAGELGSEEIDTHSDDSATLETLIDLSTEACDWIISEGDTIRIEAA